VRNVSFRPGSMGKVNAGLFAVAIVSPFNGIG
jgi:hypothetical protein